MKLYDQNIWGNFGVNDAVGNRKYLVNEMVREQDADICCFQECNPGTMRAGKDSIQNLLSDKYIEICIDKANVNFTPVFIRKDTFDVIEEGYLPYPGLNDINSKSVTYAVLREKKSGKVFTAASTHFWWEFGKESDEQRIENAIELKKLAKKLAEKYNAPFLVSGDFNSGYAECTQGPAGYEKMLDLGFSDIRGIARNTTEEFTCRKDYPVRTDDDVYINGTMPMYTIDYIFAYGDGLKAEKFDIITSQKALNSSDHCPLILDFEIK